LPSNLFAKYHVCSYPILVATEASFAHVRHTLLKSAYPNQIRTNGLDLPVDTDVATYKIPASLNREYWTPDHIERLEIDRFRPNIVLGDASRNDRSYTPKMVPWEEDGWEAFEIFDKADANAATMFGKDAEGKGRGIYTLVRCGRCMVPNIDPATGIRDAHVNNPIDSSHYSLIQSLLAAISCHHPV
jgi:uncharacterized protein YcbX